MVGSYFVCTRHVIYYVSIGIHWIEGQEAYDFSKSIIEEQKIWQIIGVSVVKHGTLI